MQASFQQFQQQKGNILFVMHRDKDLPKYSDQSQDSSAGDLFLHEKFLKVFSKYPHLNRHQAFYLEACKLHINYLKTKSKVEEAKNDIESLKSQIDFQSSEKKKVAQNSQSQVYSDDSNSERRKRVRRTANEIARHYICEVERCHKSYGSEGSLNQHMKLKHIDLFNKHMLLMSLEKNS